MIVAEYESLFTNNSEELLKDDTHALINKWFIDHVQQK